MPEVLVNENEFTVKMQIELLYAWTFFLFIFSWISVELVARAINNFTFNTLKMDEKSTFQTTIIALICIIIQLLTLNYFRTLGIVEDNSMANILSKFNNSSDDSIDDSSGNSSGKRNFVNSDHIEFITQLESISII